MGINTDGKSPLFDLEQRIQIEDLQVSEFLVSRNGKVLPYSILLWFENMAIDGLNITHIRPGSSIWKKLKNWAWGYISLPNLDIKDYRMKIVPSRVKDVLPSIQFEILPDISLD